MIMMVNKVIEIVTSILIAFMILFIEYYLGLERLEVFSSSHVA